MVTCRTIGYMARYSEPISVRFRPEDRETIRAMAEEDGTDQGTIIRRLVVHALRARGMAAGGRPGVQVQRGADPSANY